MATARTVYDRVREGRVYPELQAYKLDICYTITVVPRGYNGTNGDPITIQYANIMDVVVTLLKRKSIHGESPDNLCFHPEVCYSVLIM